MGNFIRNRGVKVVGFLLIGAGAGFAYYYFIGCNSGTCPITSNPYISTTYGAAMGLLLAINKKGKSGQKRN
jgi:hypothetical protein